MSNPFEWQKDGSSSSLLKKIRPIKYRRPVLNQPPARASLAPDNTEELENRRFVQRQIYGFGSK